MRCNALDQECSRSKEGALTETSNREPRRLVVWGTAVTRALSSSPYGTLITSAGRTFSAIPRSNSHTSPRLGVTITDRFPLPSLRCRAKRKVGLMYALSPHHPEDRSRKGWLSLGTPR